MSSKALPGEHLCKDHQGNYSHYAPHNCTICTLRANRDMLLDALSDIEAFHPNNNDIVQRIVHIARAAIARLEV